MTRDELIAFAKTIAASGADYIRDHSEMPQRVSILATDTNRRKHNMFILDHTLHGFAMAEFIKSAASLVAPLGTLEAVAIQADVRMKNLTPKEFEHYAAEERQGNYLIADDPTCDEMVLTIAATREDRICLVHHYRRTPKVVFEGEPEEMKGMYSDMIPKDLWPRVH